VRHRHYHGPDALPHTVVQFHARGPHGTQHSDAKKRIVRVSVSSSVILIATSQAATGWACPPCSRFKIQSCFPPTACFRRGLGLARGDRKWPLNDGQIPNFRGERVHVSTGYNRV
jgi:hypothetical protein